MSDRSGEAQPRAWGALATQLNQAVARAHDVLHPHTTLLPQGTLAALDAVLAELARRRVRIALYGEVKAGKSTLLNAIAGAPLSPVAFEPLTSVPLRVTYGEATTWLAAGRRFECSDGIEPLLRDNGAGIDEVVVETPLDLLQLGGQVEVLDTPGLGSAAQLDAVTANTLRTLDAVILVVRYPALFTQFTRRLMTGLQADTGKLFVVWNLDGACAELAGAERARHAENLRANVAGAHELFLVDARAAFRAAQARDPAGTAATGISALTDALARFVSSDSRNVTALREAAKRSEPQLRAAHATLSRRRAELDRALIEARTRLQDAQDTAAAEAAAAQAQLAEFDAGLARLVAQHTSAATKAAAAFSKRLRRARRRWLWRGDFAELEATTLAALARYTGEVQRALHAAGEAICSAAADFGTTVAGRPPAHAELTLTDLAPDDRRQLAATGHAQWLRRALWQRWYLPGLAAIERTGIGADVAGQAAWITAFASEARLGAADTTAERLAEIDRRAQSELQQIRTETNFAANEAEFARLTEDLPVLAAEAEAVSAIATAARGLLPPTTAAVP
ncbi:MAG: dynamin family protein [Deltaproteobacteria bacterium]|nr:dynamin family protein [Deltaproteobacteria bacterium]